MGETRNFDVQSDGHIARLTLSRPEKRNTMGATFFSELAQHFQEFDRDPDIRVVVIKGEGKSFSAGTDLQEAARLLSTGSAEGRETMRREIRRLQESIEGK